MIFALFLAIVLLLLAVFSIRRQYFMLQHLRTQTHIPSDDRRYLKNRAYRRILTGILLLGLAGMLAGTYLSGMERHAEALGEKKREVDEHGQKQPIPQEDRDFTRVYAIYWISILVLLFLVVSLAIVDIWSTRRYAWQQLRRIQTEHQAVLERDLAMYRQQKINDRMKGTK